MTAAQVARWFLTAFILGAASSVTTALVTQDAFPIGEWRDRRIARHPMRQQAEVDDWDEALNEDGGTVLVPTYTGSRLSYLLTCPRCMGIYSTAAWVGLYAISPRVGIIAGACFAAAAVQRWINAR